jgi:transcriptional regulator with GAF, ATPase, and Fis domain
VRSDDRTSPEIADGEARVLLLWEGGTERRALPEGAVLTVGRSSECDVQVDHPSVSRMHARVIGGSPARIEDLGSSNGVRVRGALIPPKHPVEVNPGDMIELGSVVLVVQGATPRAATAPPIAWDARGGSTSTRDAITPLRRLLGLVADSELSMVITGETGVGKNVAARWVHDHSPRKAMPFVLLNCAALPDALLEGELFGYEKGAFTGAAQAKQGLVESAHGGTLLLDEIGELPLATQAKLLGVLENREVLRLGSLKPRPVDLRLLAATNRDLDAFVREGRFRADLHFRLNGVTVTIPPLRERTEEIPELASLFLERACARTGRRLRLSEAAVAALVRESWPGNVRELRNTMDRAAALCTTGEILPEHLAMPKLSTVTERPPPPPPLPRPPATEGLWGETDALERQRVLEALDRCAGNQTQAAKLLGISRRALINRLELYDVPRPRKGKD